MPNVLPLRISGCFRGPNVPKQIEQVGSSADQLPFGMHLLQPAQAEAAEASLLLDLAEDRFDDDLAPPINSSSALGAECADIFTISGASILSMGRAPKVGRISVFMRRSIVSAWRLHGPSRQCFSQSIEMVWKDFLLAMLFPLFSAIRSAMGSVPAAKSVRTARCNSLAFAKSMQSIFRRTWFCSCNRTGSPAAKASRLRL